LQREGIDFVSFTSVPEVEAALEHGMPQVVVSDIHMPGGSGLDLLQQLKARFPKLPVIIMTAYSDLESAVAAFQGGAFEYLPKPFDVDHAIELIRRAVDESMRVDEAAAAVQVEGVPEILGQAPAMQEVFRAIGRLSQSHTTVLITGESGTGKELVASALHRHSPRASKPFIALNTAAIPKDLLESELFGHERGAFTGAAVQRRGRFEQADGGTLFLDEIGDMPAELQTRLLRVLADGQFYRVGGHQPIKVNVRVIAATHQDLETRVKEGLFREDLYHRLNVIRLRLPALRERSEDIPLLAKHFLQKSAQEQGVEAKKAVRSGDQASEPVCLERQRAPAGERLPLAHRDGAGQQCGCVRPAARDTECQPSEQVSGDWLQALAHTADAALNRGEVGIIEGLTQDFEKTLINIALKHTGGRRIEAANLLGGAQYPDPEDSGAGAGGGII
jgi:Response regulator containing CheY-like receiver, AAA-type ATPase, and DNA-binding domains